MKNTQMYSREAGRRMPFVARLIAVILKVSHLTQAPPVTFPNWKLSASFSCRSDLRTCILKPSPLFFSINLLQTEGSLKPETAAGGTISCTTALSSPRADQSKASNTIAT